MGVVWTNSLSMGNRIIDCAHKDILGVACKIVSLIEAGDEAALSETLKLLENSLVGCFEVEEKFAYAINIDFTQHKYVHQRLLKDFQSIRSVLEAKNGLWSDRELVIFINSWVKSFVQHIKVDGLQLKIILDTHYYDFQP